MQSDNVCKQDERTPCCRNRTVTKRMTICLSYCLRCINRPDTIISIRYYKPAAHYTFLTPQDKSPHATTYRFITFTGAEHTLKKRWQTGEKNIGILTDIDCQSSSNPPKNGFFNSLGDLICFNILLNNKGLRYGMKYALFMKKSFSLRNLQLERSMSSLFTQWYRPALLFFYSRGLMSQDDH